MHPNQIAAWKAQLVDGAAEVFGSEPKAGLVALVIDVKALHTSAGHSSELRSGASDRFRQDWRADV